MVNTNPFNRYHALFLVALVIGSLLYRGCDSIISEPPPPAETKRTGTINAHQIRQQIEAKYRQRETARFKAFSDSLTRSKVIALKAKDKAVASVKAYQNAPDLAKCDTALADLQSHVAILETTVSISDSAIASQNRLNASLNSTVAAQESVISELNTGWQQANADNARLAENIAKQKRKRFGLGFSAGYGMTDTGLSPTVNISLNYNLIKF